MSRIPREQIDIAYRDIADHLAAGRHEEAAAALRRAMEQDGPRPDLLRLLGLQLEILGRYEPACTVYRQLVADRPDPQVYEALARCCLLTGRPHEANAIAQTLADLDGCAQTAACIIAAVLTWKGKWQDALAVLPSEPGRLDGFWAADAACRRRLCENVLALCAPHAETYAALAAARPPLHVRRVETPSAVGLDAYRQGQWVRVFSLPSDLPCIPGEKQEMLQTISLAFVTLEAWPLVRQCYHTQPAEHDPSPQQSLWILEADVQAFYGLAMLEDLRPYLQTPRVHWYLGSTCLESFRRDLENDPQLFIPRVTVGTAPAVQQTINAMIASREREQEKLKAELQAYYRALPADHGQRVFSGTLGRAPRIYLVTTRLSTVLQFVTADMEQAFRRLGWETQLAIETDETRICTEYSVLRELDRFRPDVVFMLDHLRYEWLFRDFPELYHICWIQDRMPNLYCTQAGESIGPRDFVLVLGSGVDLVHCYRYPRRCLVHMPFSTNLESYDAARNVDLSAWSIPDVGFASNHGRTPAGALALVSAGVPPEARRIAPSYLHAVLHAYRTGNILYEDVQYRQILAETEERTGIHIPDEEVRVTLTRLFRLYVGGVVHRQQVLRWLKDAGIPFGLYGREWENHPEFHPFARGVVTDGATMNAIFRATPINLQISQYSNSHIRFWNGLAAGGFFLVRACPADSWRPAAENVLALLRANRGRSYREVLAETRLDTWEDIVFRSHFEENIPGHDTIDDYAIDIFMMTLEPPTWAERLGDLADRIQFYTREQCLEMIRRYRADPAARADVLARIRDVLADQTYEANLRRALAVIRERIAQDAAAAGSGCEASRSARPSSTFSIAASTSSMSPRVNGCRQ